MKQVLFITSILSFTVKVSDYAALFEATKGGRILHMQYKNSEVGIFSLGM